MKSVKKNRNQWLNRKVLTFGLTSFLSDFCHEMATSFPPQFMHPDGHWVFCRFPSLAASPGGSFRLIFSLTLVPGLFSVVSSLMITEKRRASNPELRLTEALRAMPRDYRKFLIAVSSETLKDFGLNFQNLGAAIGMTAVLHTHNRRWDFHPHVHVVVPGGGVDKARKQWRKGKNNYLFNAMALAKVFRVRFLEASRKTGLRLPNSVPRKWVVNCKRAGKGPSALKYLARYLYRGVVSENNIQLILQVVIHASSSRLRPDFKCAICQAPMQILAFFRPAWSSA